MSDRREFMGQWQESDQKSLSIIDNSCGMKNKQDDCNPGNVGQKS